MSPFSVLLPFSTQEILSATESTKAVDGKTKPGEIDKPTPKFSAFIYKIYL